MVNILRNGKQTRKDDIQLITHPKDRLNTRSTLSEIDLYGQKIPLKVDLPVVDGEDLIFLGKVGGVVVEIEGEAEG